MFIYSTWFKKKKNCRETPLNRLLTDLERQQLGHRILLADQQPGYMYGNCDLSEVTANTLIPFRELKIATLIIENCDVDLGTVQVWVHAGIRKILLIDCNIVSLRWRSALPIVANSINDQPIENYPCVQFENCMVQDPITFIILEGCTFAHVATEAGLCCSINFEPTPRLNSRCYVDMLFDGCTLDREGILKLEDDHEIPQRRMFAPR